ncbi:MAG: hypothetical protein HFJ28_00865 [Clostridia bacterium]|jgi:hypothetical protein|nr:hypothetical protein [Clostridia bacterium]
MAAQLEIPIVVIDADQCAKLEFAKVQEMLRRLKEEKKMNLIPQIIHKIENNRACPNGLMKEIRNSIFSETEITKWIEEIIGTIITANNDSFHQGIKEFTAVTKKVKELYGNPLDIGYEKCKTYNYAGYLNRVKMLFNSRHRLNSNIAVRNQTINTEITK